MMVFFAVPHTIDKTRGAAYLACNGAAVHVIRTHDPTQKQKTIVVLCGVPACVAVVHLCFVVLIGTARRHR